MNASRIDKLLTERKMADLMAFLWWDRKIGNRPENPQTLKKEVKGIERKICGTFVNRFIGLQKLKFVHL